MISVMSSVGRPTDVSTITMVTSPACGIPAAPMLAAVAVMLLERWEVKLIKVKKLMTNIKWTTSSAETVHV